MDTDIALRNPFGVQDVPEPFDQEALDFASQARARVPDLIHGGWSSRWNGGAAKDEWKRGHARIRMSGETFYALFDWDEGTQSGLIEARLEGSTTLVGRYVNLGNPEIRRPWVGTIVDANRIDGQWTLGRLDFSR
jgi:hypothetical protein